jgi:hypothetical protein
MVKIITMKKFLLLFANIVFNPFGAYSQVIVKNIEQGTNSSYPTNFYPFKDKLVFSAYTVGNNKQLYYR